MNNLIKYLFTVDKIERTKAEIIGWWELRRFVYNLVVLVCGIISMQLLSLLVELEPGEDLIEPLAMIAFAFLCNVCYTFGWFTEIFIDKSKTYGPSMFRFGLIFTVVCVFIPPLFNLFPL